MFVVEISHLDDDELALFGWVISKETEKFYIYLHVHTGEEQIVDKAGKKFLLVDDVNDANQMSKDEIIIAPGG